MRMIPIEKTLAAWRAFDTADTVVGCAPYGNGHINDTFLVSGAEGKRYILQAINTNIFKKPDEVMHNIQKVTAFLRNVTADTRRVLSLVYTKDGNAYHTDADGRAWRVYDFVEDSLCLDTPESREDFYQSAMAFGEFQKQLAAFPVEELYDVIPDFHNTPDRYQKFLQAVEADVCGRAAGVQKEIAFVTARAPFYSVLEDACRAGRLPRRVTHNDTKMNNVMLDKATRNALCVIDLDTIMPGFSVNDFGDSIRFGASTAAEDEPDLSKVSLDVSLFETYVKGFLAGCGGMLTAAEIDLLPEGAKMMTVECGMRFLTDYLQGDTYFKTKYDDHNLVRCRTQFKLVADMEEKWDELKAIVRKHG